MEFTRLGQGNVGTNPPASSETDCCSLTIMEGSPDSGVGNQFDGLQWVVFRDIRNGKPHDSVRIPMMMRGKGNEMEQGAPAAFSTFLLVPICFEDFIRN